MEKENFNVISLFSGAMGLDLGIEEAGFNIRACVEMNKWACRTIRENTNIPVIEKDINDVTTKEILETAKLKKEEVFMVVGGPPCQPFSSAGKMKGLEDFRGNVITRYLSIVEDIQPKFFILENVRGLLSAKLNNAPEEFSEYELIKDMKGSVLYFLMNEFKKYGYTLSFALFNAANYGVPQKRERVIIFGHKGKERIPLPTPTHSELGENGTYRWVSLEEAFDGLGDEHIHTNFSEQQRFYLSHLLEGQYWRHLPEELQEPALGGAYHLGGGKTGFFRRLHSKKPAPTLVTSPTMKATMIAHPFELRPLSIQEYARIQQFPDEWLFQGGKLEVYKQIGNAVPLGLGSMAGKQIMDFYKKERDLKTIEKNNVIPYSRYKNTTDYEFIELFKKSCSTAKIEIDNKFLLSQKESTRMEDILLQEYEESFVIEVLSKVKGVSEKGAQKVVAFIDTLELFLELDDLDKIGKMKSNSGRRIINQKAAQRVSETVEEIKELIDDYDIKDIRDLWTLYLVKDFLNNQIKNLNSKNLKTLDINPHLATVLQFNTEEMLDFFVTQSISRSIVTSWGSYVEKFLKYSGCEVVKAEELLKKSLTNKEYKSIKGSRADLIKVLNEKIYFIQAKSGPNTMNVEMVKGLNSAMDVMENADLKLTEEILNYEEDSINDCSSLLGMTYGKRKKISAQISGNLDYFDSKTKIGRELWNFIGEDDNYYQHIIDLLELGSSLFLEKDFSKLIRNKVNEITSDWQEEFDGKELKDVLTENFL